MDLQSTTYDVVIIGAGPAGLVAGARAAQRGMSHVVLERGRVADTVVKYQKGKHVMAEPVDLPLRSEVPLGFAAGRREEVLETWMADTRSARTNIAVGREFEVVKVENGSTGFTLDLAGGQQISAQHVIVAIGLQGNVRTFGVPGDELPHVTYQLDDPGEHIGKKVVVVGVGDSGIENALALMERNQVSIVNRRAEFARAKEGNRSRLEAAIRAAKIHHQPNSRVQSIEPGRIILESDLGTVQMNADLVIGRLGAIPPRPLLESMGIAFPSDDPAAVPNVTERYETNVPGLYLIGAAAGYPLIKNGMNQGFEVIEYLCGEDLEPADEPLLRAKFAELDGSVAEILARIQSTIPVFRGLTTIQLREFLVDSQIHTLRSGDIVFERNEFSDSFYTVLAGELEIVAPLSEVDTDTVYRDSSRAGTRRIPVGAGQFFGEMSLLSGRRRNATVTATGDCVLVESPRLSMLRLMRSVPEVHRVLDEAFIVRKLQNVLPPEIPTEALAELAQVAVLETFKQGNTLFAEGDESNGVSVIRRGSVTVARRSGAREQVLAYVPAGNIIGEMALFSPEHRRTATVRAGVLTEVVRLPAEHIMGFMERFPAVRAQLQSLHSQRFVENIGREMDTQAGDVVGFLMEEGAGEATDMLLIDESLCVRCNNCETSCAGTHGGVSRLDREAGPTFASVHVPTSCRHCENPKCMTDCPPDALRRHPSGEVFIMDNCIGCGNCATNCPYGVIQMATVKRRWPGRLLDLLRWQKKDPGAEKKAVKCDLCRELNAGGDERFAACVSACPTGAILRVDPKSFVDTLYAPSRED